MQSKRKILLVDDDADIRKVLRATLSRGGFEVFEAEGGKQGLEMVLSKVPDLIVLDVMMPEMNGAEFCRKLVDDLRLQGVRILMHSAVSKDAKLVKEVRAMEHLRFDFLKKPSGPVELKSKVIRMLDMPMPAPAKPKSEPVRRPSPRAASAEPARAKMKPASSGEPSEQKLRLLMVDDDKDLLRLHKFALKPYYEIETAENGLDALDSIDRFRPDFLLVDYNMPVMDGLEMVETIRRHPVFHTVPALFLTGNRDEDLPKRTFKSGANLFIRKPISPERLKSVLSHFTQKAELEPGKPPKKKAPAAARSKSASSKKGGAPGAVRILIIDEVPRHKSILSKFFRTEFKGQVEVLWTDDHRTALANFSRWEPDVLLYNPRNANMDGIAFFQMLRIRKIKLPCEFGFIGSDFPEAEIMYGRKNFGRGVLDLDIGTDGLLSPMRELVEQTAKKVRPKARTIEQIEAEDREHEKRSRAHLNRAKQQRDHFRQQYSDIQDFIDQGR